MDYEEPDIVSNEFMPSAVGDYDSLAWSLCISLPFILTKLGKAMTVFTPAVISVQIASGFFLCDLAFWVLVFSLLFACTVPFTTVSCTGKSLQALQSLGKQNQSQ